MSKYSQDVVRMLYEHQPEYISGQYIADQLNISRAAVKKVIDQLKLDGCDIESINHKGHLLKHSQIIGIVVLLIRLSSNVIYLIK